MVLYVTMKLNMLKKTGLQKIIRISVLAKLSCLCIITFLNLLANTEIAFPEKKNSENCPKALVELKKLEMANLSVLDHRKGLENVEQLCPSLVEGQYEFGRWYLEQGNYSEASRYFKQAENLKPRLEHALGLAKAKSMLLDFVSAETIYKEAIGKYSGHWSLLEGLGVLYLSLGKYQDAEELFRQGLQDQSLEGSLYYNLGVALERQNRIDEAMLSFKTALDKSPLLVQARVALIKGHFEKGEFLEAKRLGEQGMLHSPGNTELLIMQIQVLDTMNSPSEALRLVERLPDSTSRSMKSAFKAVLLLRDGEKEEVQKIFSEWFGSDQRVSADNLDVARAYSYFLLVEKKFEKAEMILEQIIEIRPDDASMLNNLGVACQSLGKIDKAKDYFRKAGALLPASSVVKANQEKIS